MKILIIQPRIHLGGVEMASVLLAYHLQRRGHEAAVACTFVDLSDMPPEAIHVRYHTPSAALARLCSRSRIFFLLVGPWLLLQQVWRHSRNADVLNPHAFPGAWVAAVVARFRRIPVVWTCNEPPGRMPWQMAREVGIGDWIGWFLAGSWIDRVLVRSIKVIHVLSEKARADVAARYGRESTIVRTPVDLSFQAPGNPSRVLDRYGLRGKFILLCVGKLHPQKNQVVCIGALREVLSEIPDAALVLVGDGPMRAKWLKLASLWGLSKRIRHLRRVSNEDLRDLYAACSVNLVPAENQSWGLTAFEALCAQRISIVATDSGAAEVLGAQGIAVVCRPTPEAFAANIIRISAHRGRYQAMARKGQRYVLRNLTWPQYTECLLSLMGSACENGRPSLAESANRESAR
jgi:glycosyltransferase involved in cell wall biosynthesis